MIYDTVHWKFACFEARSHRVLLDNALATEAMVHLLNLSHQESDRVFGLEEEDPAEEEGNVSEGRKAGLKKELWLPTNTCFVLHTMFFYRWTQLILDKGRGGQAFTALHLVY